MARDAVACAEVNIICNAKEYKNFYVARRWYLYRVIRRFRLGMNYFSFSMTHGTHTFDKSISSANDFLVLGLEYVSVLLYGNLFNTMM